MAEFRKEEEISPNTIQTYQAAAAVANMAGNRDAAIEEVRKLLKVDPQNYNAAMALSQWLSQKGRYSEAVEVLEGAAKGFQNKTQLQYALGAAYLKMGQKEKAVDQFRGAAEDGGSPKHDPMLLNNVAYTLAESKAGLDLARQYAAEALKEIDERSVHDTAAVDTGTRVTYQLALLWDTLGWIYFQSGDTMRSENFVHSAWLLAQDATVGEHLGEIYESQGKGKQAGHVYQLSLAAQSPPGFTVTSSTNAFTSPAALSIDAEAYKEQHDRVLSRYEKLTGKKPITEIRRLPNGEWMKTPAEELIQMRSIKLGKQPKLSGSAEFSIVFSSGRVESVDYVGGEESLEVLADKLKAAPYAVEFPAGSKARLLRRAKLSCAPSTGCVAVLMPPDEAMLTQP